MIPNLNRLHIQDRSSKSIGPVYTLEHFDSPFPEHDTSESEDLHTAYTQPIKVALTNLRNAFAKAARSDYTRGPERTRKDLYDAIKKNFTNRVTHYKSVLETTEAHIERLNALVGASTNSTPQRSRGRQTRQVERPSYHLGDITDDGTAAPPETAKEPDPNSTDVQALQHYKDMRTRLQSANRTVEQELVEMRDKYDMNTSATVTYTRKRCEDLAKYLTELDERPGVWEAKSYICDRLHAFMGGSVGMPGDTQNLLLVGDSGTGKTSTGKLLGKILIALGTMTNPNVTVKPADQLKARFEGHTAGNVHSFIEQSLESVVILDEVYSLSSDRPGSYGEEALNALVASLDEYAGCMCVMCIGYVDDVRVFTERNQGMGRRFQRPILFEDYTADELLAVFRVISSTRNLPPMEPAAEYFLNNVLQESMNSDWADTVVPTLFKTQADSIRALTEQVDFYLKQKRSPSGEIVVSRSISLFDMLHSLINLAASRMATMVSARTMYTHFDRKDPFHSFFHQLYSAARKYEEALLQRRQEGGPVRLFVAVNPDAKRPKR